MAISWGAWEYSGGNGMRVGIEVDWTTPSNGSSSVTATVDIWTENQYTYGDSQTLNYGGSIGGSTGFTNNDGGSPQKRATKTYTYNYTSTQYGSSPGTRTFTASLSGAYNGVTPSKSVTSNIPARPIAAPAAPTSVAVSRISDTSTKVSWVNHADAGNPYETLTLQRSVNGGAWVTVSSSISGSATSYTNGTAANQKVRYQIRANNDAGSSGFAASGYLYTSPLSPGAASRADSGADQVITWSNTGMGYTEYVTEIIGYKNDILVGVLGSVATGITTYTHLASAGTNPYTSGDRWKYTARHKTSTGTALYSPETAFTSETAGVTSPPLAPTGLDPNGGQIDPTKVNTFKWTFNPTDTSGQAQFQIRHRLVGAGSWTTESVVTSGTKSWNLPVNTYTNGDNVEWQVTTKGSDATWSPWSSSAFVTMFVTKRVPAHLDLGTGTVEADYSGFEWKVVGSGGQPAFQNSWVNYGAPFRSTSFCRRSGVTWLGGLVKNGTAGSVIFTLPEGYRPGAQIIVDAIVNTLTDSGVTINDIAIRLEIFTNGDVKHHNTGFTAGTGYISLEGISFLAEL